MRAEKSPQLLSDAELIVECGNIDSPDLWDEFLSRYHNRLLIYVIRRRRSFGLTDNEEEAARDLIQEVYIKLLANDRRAMREFNGIGEYSAPAYLASIVSSVVADYERKQNCGKRDALMIYLDEPIRNEDSNLRKVNLLADAEENSPERMMIERLTVEELRSLLKTVLTGPAAGRDALIFQLHVISELTAKEIAKLPNFKMTVGSVEAVLVRVRRRLREALSRSDAPKL